MRARGQESACGVAGESAGPTAWGWVRDFSENSTRLRLSALPCPSVRGRWQGVVARSGGGVGCVFGEQWRCRLSGSGTPGAGQGSGLRPAAWGWVRFFWGIQSWCAFWRSPAGPCGRPRRLICIPHPGSGIALQPAPCGAPMLCPPGTSMPRPSTIPSASVRARWRWCGAAGCPEWFW